MTQSLQSKLFAASLARMLRAHGCPARVVVGRKTGQVKIRTACQYSIPADQKHYVPARMPFSWRLSLLEPTYAAVRSYLGY